MIKKYLLVGALVAPFTFLTKRIRLNFQINHPLVSYPLMSVIILTISGEVKDKPVV